jgi:hypothetical protein
MRITVLRVVRSNIYRRLEESYCSHLSSVKMDAAVTDISDDPMHHNKRRHIPNNNHLHSHRTEKPMLLLRNLTSLCTEALYMIMNYSRIILSPNNNI